MQQAFERANFELADAFSEACDYSRKEAVDYLKFWDTIELTSSKTKVDAMMRQLLQQFGDLDTRPSVPENMDCAFDTLDGAIKSDDGTSDGDLQMLLQQFGDLDMPSSVVENAEGSSVTTSNPLAHLKSLILQVAKEKGLDVADELADVEPVSSGDVASAAAKSDR
ncbi:Charged multivesicular body protein 1a, partial [Stegodyphus mimosarum]